jgi:hypothetical protein
MSAILEDFFFLHLTSRIEKERLGVRGHHTSMVHNATTVEDHYQTLLSIDGIRSRALNQIANKELAKVQEKCREVVNKYYKKYGQLKEMLAYLSIPTEEEWKEFLTEIQFIELNRRDSEIEGMETDFANQITEYEQEIEYPKGESFSYIVTGGARIARGLTLEGLTITCFSRRAVEPNYDTMLQMARWCGYRAGYEDLVRILTTKEIRDDYGLIFEAEANMRFQLNQLTDDCDPVLEVIWIKMSDGLNVSGRLPTKSFRKVISGFSNFLAEYTWSHYPAELITSAPYGAFEAYRRRLEPKLKLSPPPKGESNYRVHLNFNVLDLDRFVNEYLASFPGLPTVCPQRDILRSAFDQLKAYPQWNVAVATSGKGTPFTHSVSCVYQTVVRTPDNNKIKQVHSGFETATRIDMAGNELREKPLLLIYLADATTLYGDGTRCFPGADEPVVLVGIVSPVAKGKRDEYMRGNRDFSVPRPRWLS